MSIEGVGRSAEELRAQITQAEEELRALKDELSRIESQDAPNQTNGNASSEGQSWKWPLESEEYERYTRQLIVPGFGVEGQLRLRNARVLIVGAGGLGCPAAVYLAGAGVGTLGIVDGDVVEPSNLHRQIGHASSRVGQPKAASLIAHLRSLNPLPRYEAHATHLSTANAAEIVSRYDVVLDCTDHPAARYLVSDACVLLGKPLVSAAALRTSGQLSVLNWPAAPPGSAQGGPCYRCVWPRAPPPDAVVPCGEGGVLGPVVGTMGVLQAGEALKIIVSGPNGGKSPPSMLLFSSPLDGPPSLRVVRLRGRRADCRACSAAATVTLASLLDGSEDYVAFCGGMPSPGDMLAPEERMSAAQYQALRKSSQVNKDHLLLDVREPEHFALGAIEGAVNVPYSTMHRQLQNVPGESEAGQNGGQNGPEWMPITLLKDAPIYVVCRVGNDSQVATKQLKEIGLGQKGNRFIGDIKGGMMAWKNEVDKTWPIA